MNPEYRFTDDDVRGNAGMQVAAVQYLLDYTGDFKFLVAAKTIVELGMDLSVNTVRGVANCMLNDPKGVAMLPDIARSAPRLRVVNGGKSKRKKPEGRSPEDDEIRKCIITPKQKLKGKYLVYVGDKGKGSAKHTHISRRGYDKYGNQETSELRYYTNWLWNYEGGYYYRERPPEWRFFPAAWCSARLGSDSWNISETPREGYTICPKCQLIEDEGGLKRLRYEAR